MYYMQNALQGKKNPEAEMLPPLDLYTYAVITYFLPAFSSFFILFSSFLRVLLTFAKL
jgi:hypothetical protein